MSSRSSLPVLTLILALSGLTATPGHAASASTMATLKRAAAESPGDPTAANALGLAQLRAGDLAGAIASFGQAIAIDPYTAAYFGNRALAYAQRKNTALALADLNSGLRFSPGDPRLLAQRAALLGARAGTAGPGVDISAQDRQAAATIVGDRLEFRNGLSRTAISDRSRGISPVYGSNGQFLPLTNNTLAHVEAARRFAIDQGAQGQRQNPPGDER